ncbi:MAG: SLC13 family permease [Bacteroidota bacterium]
MYLLLQTPATDVSSWPIFVLLISVLFIVVAITRLKLHAFLALILAGILAGWLMSSNTWEMVEAIGKVGEGFGKTAGGVGLVIALAAIIGMGLMDSGAADSIVRRMVRIFGEKRAAWAMLISGYLLSVPVFFDTVFFLVIPLVQMLALRLGKNYVLFVMAVAAGAAVTHSLVPPTPGPLLAADLLNLDLGIVMMVGFSSGIVPALAAMWYAKYLDKTSPIPVREGPGLSLKELEVSLKKSDSELPSFGLSLLPVVLPAVLLAGFSIIDLAEKSAIKADVVATFSGSAEALSAAIKSAQADPANFSTFHAIMQLMGNKIIALGLGAFLALWILVRQAKLDLKTIGEKCAGPLEVAGVIILITSAGGAFGGMIRESGIGDVVQFYAEQYSINYIFLAWLFTAIIRIAQGSATVALITGGGLMVALMANGIDVHPIYLFLGIGFGSIGFSWMNDSGFWIVGKLSGFTEKETLKSWSVSLSIISIVGLIQTLIVSWIFPMT